MLKQLALGFLLTGASTAVVAQNEQAPGGLKQRQDQQTTPGSLSVAPGTHILLNMINSVSTKQAQSGDRIYLETAFPVLAGNKIVVPQGSWVTGTITDVKRPGRMSGRGQLQVRFDSLILPNGVTRDFRADLGSLDGRNEGDLKKEQSKISGPGDKKGDTREVVGTTVTGAGLGAGIGAAAGNWGKGSVIGMAGGAAAGLAAVMLTRGPDATLPKGSTVEMVLDRPLSFQESELDFSKAPPRAVLSEGSQTAPRPREGLTPRAPW